MECGKNTSICIFPNYNFGPWNLLYLHVCGYFKQYSSFSMLCVKHVHNSSLILVSDSYVCDKIRFLLPFKILEKSLMSSFAFQKSIIKVWQLLLSLPFFLLGLLVGAMVVVTWSLGPTMTCPIQNSFYVGTINFF